MNTMYETFMTIDDVTVACDRIDRAATNNVMPCFPEEQPITWTFAKPYIANLVREQFIVKVIDVGTGSGIFGILMGKHFPFMQIYGVDINERAIQFTKRNAQENSVPINLIHGRYAQEQYEDQSVHIIMLNPPYHPYPKEHDKQIPLHANAGEDGQEAFREELSVAKYHVMKNGLIFWNQMAFGNASGPDLLEYIPKLTERNVSIDWVNIFPPIKSLTFLQGVYGERFSDWSLKMARKKLFLYYTVGVVKNDNKGTVRCLDEKFGLTGIADIRQTRSWGARIALHREIALHIK